MPEDPARHGEHAVTPTSTPPTSQRNPADHLRVYSWRPGQTGNPAGTGAPLRSFAAHIRAQTGWGREIAAFYLAIMRGEPIKMPEKVIKRGRNGKKRIAVQYIRPTLDQRIDAAAWLADRGWGKAKETIELTGEATPAQRLELLRRLSEDERTQLRSLLQRALESNGTAIPAPSNSVESTSALLQMPESVDSEPAPQPPVESS
jgi:hypothetical protein